MRWLATIIGIGLILGVLVDAFEVVLLPRRVRYGYRLARGFYRSTWQLGRALARLPVGRWRQTLLAVFGPISLVALVIVWVGLLITGFGLMHWSLGTDINTMEKNFSHYFYFSATTFFTLGYGDLVPTGPTARALSVTEAGLGYIFLAVIICYLPVLYQAFSRREIAIALLDARAGSPPTAGELLRRLDGAPDLIQGFLVEWERWAAELLETHISFPMLSYYRSQHENQSWIGALATILDTCAIFLTCVDGLSKYQARLTFAMARHAVVDLALVFSRPPQAPSRERLPGADFARLRQALGNGGLQLRDEAASAKALAEVRLLYEPFLAALAEYFAFVLPRFLPDKPPVDNWQTTPWTPRSPGLGRLSESSGVEDHFD